MMPKIKHCLLVALLSGVFMPAAFSQGEKNKDTLPVRDSLLIDALKDNMQDNIPVISLDENDAQDGSAQNISSQLLICF